MKSELTYLYTRIKTHPKRKSLTLALAGTIVEYFDYALYGFLAIPIAKHFLSPQAETAALLKVFAVFAIGVFAKPLGAVFFGYIGDKFGRKWALRFSMLGIAVPTFFIAVLPGYETLGNVASLLLLFCRFIQGALVVGEADGVRIFIFEHVSSQRKCFANAISELSMMIGISLASLAASIIVLLGESDKYWRIPFLLGVFLGGVIFYLRRDIGETPEFLKTPKNKFEGFREIFRKNYRNILACILICGASGGLYHFYIIFWGTFTSKMINMQSVSVASFNTTISLFCYTVMLPISGFIADHFKKQEVMRRAMQVMLGLALLHMVCFYFGVFPLILSLATVIAMSFFTVPAFAALAGLFEVPSRFRSLSIGHTLGSSLFSGTTPFLSTFLWHQTKFSIAPLFYFVFLILLGKGGVYLMSFKRARG